MSIRVVEHFDGRSGRLLDPHSTTIIAKVAIDLAYQLLDPWLSNYLLDMGAGGALWAIPTRVGEVLSHPFPMLAIDLPRLKLPL